MRKSTVTLGNPASEVSKRHLEEKIVFIRLRRKESGERKKERKRGKRERKEWHPSPLHLIWSLKCEPSVLKSFSQ